MLDAKNSAAIHAALERKESSEVRARLQREVIEAAKAWWNEGTRINNTTYTSPEKLRLRNGADALLEPVIEALIDFESTQQQIKK